MNNSTASWIEQAWSVLGSIPGASDAVAQERLLWEEFRRLDTLEVVVFGAYDVGKSSLLKRLLIDWSVPIPEWLTVSGRRETFESKRVEAQGLGLIDTPGFSSGNNEHDALTFRVMRLADAYLWVMPPQLLTTGKDKFLEVLFGDIGIAASTIAVIARMDESGVDPSDNEIGFTDICDRKKKELSSIIGGNSTSRHLVSVHCVVADPYQMVGNLMKPDPGIYDIGRNWDGMEGLAREVLALREQRDHLRTLAGSRFVCLLLRDMEEELCRLTDELTLSREGIDNEIDSHAIYEQRLDALQRQARAKLHRQIEDALLSVSRSGDTGTDCTQILEETLTKAIDEWSEGSFADYRQLAGELELHIRERMAAPSMNGFRRLAQETEEMDAKVKGLKVDPLKTGRKVLEFAAVLRNAFEIYAAAELGMSLKDAADRLQKLELSGETVEAFIKSQGQRAAFRGSVHAKKASQFVKWATVLDSVGPLVEQLGGALLDLAGEVMTARLAEERAQQRLEIRLQLRIEAEKLEETTAVEFASTCDGLRQWLSERLLTLVSGRENLSKQIETLKQSLSLIRDLVSMCPS